MKQPYQQYRVCAVLAFSLGHSAEVPRDIMAVLKNQRCSTPFVPEIVATLTQLGYDARREQEPCSDEQVGIWITVNMQPMLLQCELETLALH
ncbi:hypothetical protein Z042_14155 [Chania multitudinisentens RB-25]|uniref:Uncharacterized protein n=1 Tax=Chania multitudinisentens RB-25 TaxID=1441930 RepID=W0LFB1_9GAMM|nr:hypothetical protein [Chania multitudinisentens]AHG20635.1 hypothetical protein Z042_14155 [Chania multitudinisentens RB-25]